MALARNLQGSVHVPIIGTCQTVPTNDAQNLMGFHVTIRELASLLMFQMHILEHVSVDHRTMGMTAPRNIVQWIHKTVLVQAMEHAMFQQVDVSVAPTSTLVIVAERHVHLSMDEYATMLGNALQPTMLLLDHVSVGIHTLGSTVLIKGVQIVFVRLEMPTVHRKNVMGMVLATHLLALVCATEGMVDQTVASVAVQCLVETLHKSYKNAMERDAVM